jgi:hypothetical protein
MLMKRFAILPVIAVQISILLTSCAPRSEGETAVLSEKPPVVGLSETEPTPEEVAVAREDAPETRVLENDAENEITAAEVKRPKRTGAARHAELAKRAQADPDPKGDEALKFCHSADWSATCLYLLMVYRCGQYAFPFTPYGCAAASVSFVSALDLKRIDVTFEEEDGQSNTYNLPVIFTAKLESMIESPKVQKEIHELKRHLEISATNRRAFDLWSWAYGISNADSEKAVEWLSVLLQDTSPVQIQVEYLRILEKAGKLSAGASRALDELMMISDFLTHENLNEVKWKEWLRLYPTAKGLEEEATTLIYHFYPMSYLAQKLKRMHGARLASFLPFLFNTEYLNQDIDPEMWPLKHPRSEKIDLKLGHIRWKMRDLYGGYAGALFGVGHIAESPGLEKIQQAYAKDPFKTMQRLFWTMP